MGAFKGSHTLPEAEMVSKLLLCVSSLIIKGLGNYFPGLNAMLALKLRLASLDPLTGLALDPMKYMNVFTQIVGGGKRAEVILRQVLPSGSVFDEITRILLSEQGDWSIETNLLSLIKRHRKVIRSWCKDV